MSKKSEITTSPDYLNFVNLLAVVAELDLRLKELQAELQSHYLTQVDDIREKYAELQAKSTAALSAVEVVARSHPEWFGKAKSIKTPYGTVKFHSSSGIQASNEEVSILLIEQTASEDQKERFIRTEKKLNLDALKSLSDADLRRFRLSRYNAENFSVKPVTVDLGKAVQQAEAKEAA